MLTISLHITEEELNEKIREEVAKATTQIVQTFSSSVSDMIINKVPLEIAPDEMLTITVGFSDDTSLDTMHKILSSINDAFISRGFTRFVLLPSSSKVKIDISLMKQQNDVRVTNDVSATDFDDTDF